MTERTNSPAESGSPVFAAPDSRLLRPSDAHSNSLDGHPLTADKAAKGSYFRYLGFTHQDNVRVFRFRRVSHGEEAREFIVNVDLALFAQHHVSLQEGPALSLQFLASEPDDGVIAPLRRCLTSVEMLAYIAGRPDRSASGRRPKAAPPKVSRI